MSEIVEPLTRSEAEKFKTELLERFSKEAEKYGLIIKDSSKKPHEDWKFFMSLEFKLKNSPSQRICDWLSFCKENTGRNSTIPDRLLVPEAIQEKKSMCKRYKVGGKMVYLEEYKPRGRKFQFICTGADGSECKYSLTEFFAHTTEYIG